MERVVLGAASIPLFPTRAVWGTTSLSPVWNCIALKEKARCGGVGERSGTMPNGSALRRLGREIADVEVACELGALGGWLEPFEKGKEEYCHFEPLLCVKFSQT